MDDVERNLRPATDASAVSGSRGAAEIASAAWEKESFLLQRDAEIQTARLRPTRAAGRRIKACIVAFIGCSIALIWLLRACYFAKPGNEEAETPSAGFELVKYQAPAAAAAAAPAATPSTGILNVFQVYQPVLTPSGATDETTLSDGKDTATTIAPTSSESSCQVLLMDHSFQFSYGKPFVGMVAVPFYLVIAYQTTDSI